jgi:hypothetical protein
VIANSSIPDYQSIYKEEIFSPDNRLFAGNIPTISYITVTPASYQYSGYIDSQSAVGYLISSLFLTTQGSSLEPQNIALTSGFKLTVQFVLNDNGVITLRTAQYNFFNFLGTVFGEISGVVGLFAIAVVGIETAYNSFTGRHDYKKRLYREAKKKLSEIGEEKKKDEKKKKGKNSPKTAV